MNKKFLFWLLIGLLVSILTVFGFGIFLHFLFGEDNPYASNPTPSWLPNRGSFLIEPDTIFDSLEKSKVNIFTPNLYQIDEVAFTEPINWSSSEHFLVADALNQLVWKDDLDEWNLYDMDFLLVCQENPSGFERSYMAYFKGSISYDIRHYSIMPMRKYVEWREGNGYPRPLFGWKKVDLGRLKINAESALRIAEESGGKDFRLIHNNDCNIRVSLMPERMIGWQVTYSLGNSPEFEISINPYTGKIIDNK